jgi:CheY-like chemotaxis protein
MIKKILIIDDDPDYVEATATLLEAKGFEVASAENGAAGLAAAKAAPPDLIILDVMMTSNTEGFETARAIKEAGFSKPIPVIIVSGARRELNLPFGFEPDSEWLPVKKVLEKPVKPEVLLKTIAEM